MSDDSDSDIIFLDDNDNEIKAPFSSSLNFTKKLNVIADDQDDDVPLRDLAPITCSIKKENKETLGVKDNDTNDDDDDWHSDNQDYSKLYVCVCKKPATSDFIICDDCMDFYHLKCVCLTKEAKDDIGRYTCPFCTRDVNYLKKYYDLLPTRNFFKQSGLKLHDIDELIAKHDNKMSTNNPKLSQKNQKKSPSFLKNQIINNKTEKTSILIDRAPENRPNKLAQEKPKKVCLQQTKGNSRDNAKDLLKTAIFNRLQTSDDSKLSLRYQTKEQLDSIVNAIEEAAFKELDTKKYSQKLRALIFNVRDVKNETLYKRLLTMSPQEIIHMTHENMNEYLAEQLKREQQAKLDKITQEQLKVVEEAKNLKRVKITKQGIFVLGDDDYQTLRAGDLNDDHNEETLHRQHQQQTDDKSSTTSVDNSDTTHNHQSHLYDQNCKICSGHQIEPVNMEFTPIESHKIMSRQVSHESNKTQNSIDDSIPDINVDLTMLNKIPSECDILSMNSNQRKSSVSQDFAFSPPSNVSYGPSTLEYVPSESVDASVDVLWQGNVYSPDLSKEIKLKAIKLGSYGAHVSFSIELPLKFDLRRCNLKDTWAYIDKVKLCKSYELIVTYFEGQNTSDNQHVIKLIHLFKEKSCLGMTKINGNAKSIYFIPFIGSTQLPQELIDFEIEGKFKIDRNKSQLIGIILKSIKKSPLENVQPDLPTPPDTNDCKRKSSLDALDAQSKKQRLLNVRDPRLNRQTSSNDNDKSHDKQTKNDAIDDGGDDDDIQIIHESVREYNVEDWRNELRKSIDFLSKMNGEELTRTTLNKTNLEKLLKNLMDGTEKEQQDLEKKHQSAVHAIKLFNIEQKEKELASEKETFAKIKQSTINLNDEDRS